MLGNILLDQFLPRLNEKLSPENQIFLEGDLCPYCRRNFEELEHRYDGDWTKVLGHVRVKRLLLSHITPITEPNLKQVQSSVRATGYHGHMGVARDLQLINLHQGKGGGYSDHQDDHDEDD